MRRRTSFSDKYWYFECWHSCCILLVVGKHPREPRMPPRSGEPFFNGWKRLAPELPASPSTGRFLTSGRPKALYSTLPAMAHSAYSFTKPKLENQYICQNMFPNCQRPRVVASMTRARADFHIDKQHPSTRRW